MENRGKKDLKIKGSVEEIQCLTNRNSRRRVEKAAERKSIIKETIEDKFPDFKTRIPQLKDPTTEPIVMVFQSIRSQKSTLRDSIRGKETDQTQRMTAKFSTVAMETRRQWRTSHPSSEGKWLLACNSIKNIGCL
jgi:hypothetical protein